MQCPADEVLVCVSGSIAAANVHLVVHRILERKIACSVTVALSAHGRKFVSEETLAILTGRPCVVDVHEDALGGRPTHVELAHRCAAALVVPATANLIGKLANGIIDDTLTLLLSVFENPIIVFPAIHPTTIRKKAVARNIEQLKADGYLIYGPLVGYSISERKRGLGPWAMPEPDVVAAYLEYLLRFGSEPPSGSLLDE